MQFRIESKNIDMSNSTQKAVERCVFIERSIGMDRKNLQQHIRTLALLAETNAPVISCYLNLGSGMAPCRDEFQERAGILRKNVGWHARLPFEEAVVAIETSINVPPQADARGMAIFARGGASPFLMPLQFQVPLPTWIAVNSTPNVYHLMEMKDTYHRFVTVITTEKSIRILEVNLGQATEALWKEFPETRERVGREWAKRHYQSQFRSPAKVWIREAVQVLEVLMSKGGYKHLILAGDLTTRTLLWNALPERLWAMVAGTVVASESDPVSDVVAATIASFVQHEEMESLATVEQLQSEINAQGLAVSGSRDTMRALQTSAVDVLIVAQAYEPPPAWLCADCGKVGLDSRQLDLCSIDGRIRRLDLKEEMIRLAALDECTVETVKHSDALMRLGGVGAILRCRESDGHLAATGMARFGKFGAA
jgi:hypothetical protein